MKYARDGYRFYSVSTPSFFREIELPEADEDLSTAQKKALNRLEKAAERHGVPITSSPYQLG